MKHVTSYTDFRIYLKDWISERKSSGLPASNRWFSQKMGINSTSWLTLLLQGKRGLSGDTASKLSFILKLSKIESRYFETLVLFNQASTLNDRNRYYEQLLGLKQQKHVKQISEALYEYYGTWYHSAIRAIIGLNAIKDDFEKLASLLSPPITPTQARKSVALLENLSFIKKNEQGYYVLTDTAVTTGSYFKSLAIENYQQITMQLAQEALDRYKREKRDISTVTIGISQSSIPMIKDILREAREKIVELANNTLRANCVYQVNMQLFPLSRVPIENNVTESVISESSQE